MNYPPQWPGQQPQQPYPQQPQQPQQPYNPYAPGQGGAPQQPYPQQPQQPQQPYPQQPYPQQQGWGQQPPGTLDPHQVFAGWGQAKASVNAIYHKPGKYIERIDNVKIDMTSDGTNQQFLAIELTILHVLESGPPGNTHNVGDQVTIMLMKKHQVFMSKSRHYFSRMAGIEDSQLTEDIFIRGVSHEQPFRGVVVRTNCYPKLKKKAQEKPAHMIVEQDWITPCDFEKRLTAAEVKQGLTENELAQFFPGGLLEAMAQADGSDLSSVAPAKAQPTPQQQPYHQPQQQPQTQQPMQPGPWGQQPQQGQQGGWPQQQPPQQYVPPSTPPPNTGMFQQPAQQPPQQGQPQQPAPLTNPFQQH